MNLAAIRHEATQEYCFCLEPGRFLFRLQTAKNDLRRVILHSRDKYIPLEYQAISQHFQKQEVKL